MNKGVIYCIGLGALILLLFVLNLLLGSVSIPASDVLRILMGDTSEKSSWQFRKFSITTKRRWAAALLSLPLAI